VTDNTNAEMRDAVGAARREAQQKGGLIKTT